jgi:hypothetical protein
LVPALLLWLGGPTASFATYGPHDINPFAGVGLVTRHDTGPLRQAYGLHNQEWARAHYLENGLCYQAIRGPDHYKASHWYLTTDEARRRFAKIHSSIWLGPRTSPVVHEKAPRIR